MLACAYTAFKEKPVYNWPGGCHMRVLITQNIGATDYWRFPWLRYRGHYAIEMMPPIFGAAVLETIPNLTQFVREQPRMAEPEVYYPLEDEPGISRLFAKLTDSDGVLAFANAYGLLGFEEVSRLRAYQEELDERGERVWDWLHQARQLRRLYEVWNLVESGNEKELRRIIQWSSHGVSAILPEIKGHVIADGLRNTAWLYRWKPRDVFGPARLYMVDQFNQNMRNMASPMLLLDAKGALRPYNSPSSLLAAMWLEFGQVASGVRKQIACESCGQWMDVTNNRSHKRKHDRCSLREKMARYRQGKTSTKTPVGPKVRHKNE
jgi:hypothetical protein